MDKIIREGEATGGRGGKRQNQFKGKEGRGTRHIVNTQIKHINAHSYTINTIPLFVFNIYIVYDMVYDMVIYDKVV